MPASAQRIVLKPKQEQIEQDGWKDEEEQFLCLGKPAENDYSE